MNITIIKPDRMCIIDGVAHIIDMDELPSNIHAIQWDGSSGWVEYNNGAANEEITAIDQYQVILDRHAEAVIAASDPYYYLDNDASLSLAQQLKHDELRSSLAVAESQPVTVGDYIVFGGKESMISLDGQKRLVRDYISVFDNSVTDVTFFGPDGEFTVPLESDTEIDAMDIVAQATQVYSALAFNYAAKVRAVYAANTREEVEEILF